MSKIILKILFLAFYCTVVHNCYNLHECVVPENFHTHPMDGQWKFRGGGVGGLKGQNF